MKKRIVIVLVDGRLSLVLQYNIKEAGIPFSRPLRELSLLYNFNSMLSRH
jgi:hypothetical protein